MQPERTTIAAPQGEAAGEVDDESDVELAATPSGDGSRESHSLEGRVERLRRLAADIRVAQLERELERERRRREELIERYEQVLAGRTCEESETRAPVFSWLGRH